MTPRTRTLWRRLRHRAVRLGQVRGQDHALLAEAILQLAMARIWIALVPFPRIARRLGGFIAPERATKQSRAVRLNPDDTEKAQKIGWAVTIAARHAPFAAVCLPQAIAAHHMLRTRGISSVIHFGTAPGQALTLQAHAWLDAGDVEVTGYPIAPEFTEIACLAGRVR